MNKIVSLVVTVIVVTFSSMSGFAAETQQAEQASSDDKRLFVSMPKKARNLMRKDMLDHMAALNEIIGHLANNDLKAAAKTAETRMGRSSMGKHRGTGMGPGRFMPDAMHSIGRGMHDDASEFAEIANKGDLKAAYVAVQKITGRCVSCHYAFRIR